MIYARSLWVLLVGMLVLGGCDLSINSSIDVPDGGKVLGQVDGAEVINN